LPQKYGTEFDLDALLRMDTATQIQTYAEGVKGGLLKPDEGRAKLGYRPVEGGNAVYLQQQNFSLAALAKRDAQEDPFSTTQPTDPELAAEEVADEENRRFALALRLKFAEATANA
jgi:phage portal protein BeeE